MTTPTPRRLRVLLTGLAALLALGAAPPATADAMPEEATGWYLALGDSLAAGYQPGLGEDRSGGYVGRVLDAVAAQEPKTRLRNLSCSGETTATMVAGGRCDYEEGSQLAQALTFLRAHDRTTRLVTVTIGGNDLRPCLVAVDVAGCAGQAVAAVDRRLAHVLQELRTAAPRARIVVTNYYNPYLALWFTDPERAELTAVLADLLNQAIAHAAGPSAEVADVATWFRSGDWTPLPDGVPTNVAVICRTTWMCTPYRDFHANDAGHALIAAAVVARL